MSCAVRASAVSRTLRLVTEGSIDSSATDSMRADSSESSRSAQGVTRCWATWRTTLLRAASAGSGARACRGAGHHRLRLERRRARAAGARDPTTAGPAPAAPAEQQRADHQHRATGAERRRAPGANSSRRRRCPHGACTSRSIRRQRGVNAFGAICGATSTRSTGPPAASPTLVSRRSTRTSSAPVVALRSESEAAHQSLCLAVRGACGIAAVQPGPAAERVDGAAIHSAITASRPLATANTAAARLQARACRFHCRQKSGCTLRKRMP